MIWSLFTRGRLGPHGLKSEHERDGDKGLLLMLAIVGLPVGLVALVLFLNGQFA
jgi:hypothetical protein